MRLRRNDLPEMIEGESRAVQLSVDGPLAPNTVTTAEVTSQGSGLSFSAPVINGYDITFTVTANNTGVHEGLVTLTTSSSETLRAKFRAKVNTEYTFGHYSSDYGNRYG